MGAIGADLRLRQRGGDPPRGFDFSRGTLPQGVALARGSGGYRIDAAGNLASLAADGARFDHRLAGMAWIPAGLLVEPAATNLFLNSDALSATGGGNTALSTDGTLAPAGGAAQKLSALAAGAAVRTQSIAAPGGAISFSVFARKGTGPAVGNRFGISNVTRSTNLVFCALNYDSGSISYSTGSSGASAEALAGGWWRVSIVVSGVIAGDQLNFYLGFPGSTAVAGDFAYLSGAQVEAGAAATSYVASGAGAGIRAADVVTLDWSSRGVSDGAATLRHEFDGGGTQDQLATIAGGSAVLATNLNARRILRVTAL
ncbi:MAG: hypothetical protein EOP59_00355 [Sphingomonadales bacterium]|nr:MAG: hypothetical protein EOP59_00355 [Sphingomonadales bacterium]